MMLANLNGILAEARPRATAHCPHCAAPVIAKCGPVTAWHWAHKAADCDTWAEPATRWHADWQSRFPTGWREQTIGSHRADVRTPAGTVIEFQHSTLSADDIWQREAHYGPNMLWVYDTVAAYRAQRLTFRRKAGANGRVYYSFRWRHPRRSVMACQRMVYLDCGDGLLFEMRKLHPGPPYYGWGLPRSVDQFLSWHGVDQQPWADLKDVPAAAIRPLLTARKEAQ